MQSAIFVCDTVVGADNVLRSEISRLYDQYAAIQRHDNQQGVSNGKQRITVMAESVIMNDILLSFTPQR